MDAKTEIFTCEWNIFGSFLKNALTLSGHKCHAFDAFCCHCNGLYSIWNLQRRQHQQKIERIKCWVDIRKPLLLLLLLVLCFFFHFVSNGIGMEINICDSFSGYNLFVKMLMHFNSICFFLCFCCCEGKKRRIITSVRRTKCVHVFDNFVRLVCDFFLHRHSRVLCMHVA